MMKNPDPKTDPCFYCTAETGRNADEDVWEFIKTYNIPYCDLYDKGYKRLGCIGCPMNTTAEAELERYPKYKQNYIRAFDRMLEMFEEKPENWTDGKAVMDWWLGKKTKPKELEGQINIFEQEIMEDILKGD